MFNPIRHPWFSGRMLACHVYDPVSLPADADPALSHGGWVGSKPAYNGQIMLRPPHTVAD